MPKRIVNFLKNRRAIGHLWFPIAMVLLTLCVDTLVLDTTASGLLGLVALGCMSFYLHPRYLILWSLVLTLVFARFLGAGVTTSHDWWTFGIRVATFVTGAVGCVMASSLRLRLESARDNVQEVLSNLPVPVLIADGNGTIQFCNRQMEILFGSKGRDLMGGSFFNFFSDPLHRGQEIARFLSWVDYGVKDDEPVSFTLLTDPPMKIEGKISVTTFDKKPSLVFSASVIDR